ncbi:uncharacterized protein LOC143282272 [Babylonia areolata]|uniref:uncharacterized protein LOC143282272 n=1 Tax=Babylonia areolata TaxID=304850 RepID=UPI003FD23DE2
MTEEASTSSPSAEAEGEMSPTVLELLLPPLLCLACISAGLVLWTLGYRYSTKKKAVHISCQDVNGKDVYAASLPCPESMGHAHHVNKVYPSDDLNQQDSPTFASAAERTNRSTVFTLNAKPQLADTALGGRDGKEGLSVPPPPLFQPRDLALVDILQGRSPINVRELFYILMPVIFTLGFCPVTLLLHKPVVTYLWPTDSFSSPPNINDAIACFLVPAGMVYAISFGFAFQQVAGGYKDCELGVTQQAEQLTKLLVLVKNLKAVCPATRLAMVRVIKDMTLTSLSRLLGQTDSPLGDISQGIEDLLRLLYASKLKNVANVKDADPWQRSLYQRLEGLLTRDDYLAITFSKSRMHTLEWVFLESLGYFTFLGMLIVQASSYRTELAMCLITVVSISLLCYLVADLDSPFHGFLRVPLDGFARLTERLQHEFNRAVGELFMEKSFVDL